MPFYFEYHENGYEKLCSHFRQRDGFDHKKYGLPKGKWEEHAFWLEKEHAAPEMDIYPYLLSLFQTPDELSFHQEANLGTSFVYHSAGVLSIRYFQKPDDKGREIRIQKLGVEIYRNGIGMLWYELNLKGFSGELPADSYLKFQRSFKELARHNNDQWKRKTGYDSEKSQDILEPFSMGEWIAQLFDIEGHGIEFWSARQHRSNDGKRKNIPDKALLFQYLFVNNINTDERRALAFRAANGYDNSYCVPDQLEEAYYEPFGNVTFYQSCSGAAYIAEDDQTNTAFFCHNFSARFRSDYFCIFMLLLYQSYSCAHYARLLSKLPADIHDIISDEKYFEQLETLDDQIDLFLVKSVFESVSSVQHQNGVYRHGKRMLCMDEDIQSLKIGLDALRMIEKERYDSQHAQWERTQDVTLNIGVTLFGLLSIFSAFTDLVGLLEIQKNSVVFHTVEWYAGVGWIILLTSGLIWALIRSLCKPRSYTKKNKKAKNTKEKKYGKKRQDQQ